MSSLRSAICLVCLVTLTATQPLRAADDPFAPIAPAMQKFVDSDDISGAVTLVAGKDKVLYQQAIGTTDGTRKMQTDDLFWIASMSKPITAVAAAICVDDGKLTFDDPVEKYIPEFKDLKVGSAPTSRPVTVRDLLTHTSGLPEYSKTQPHWKLADFARQIASQSLRFQPGTRWQYSTAGMDCVGRIVEVASGMPFDQFLQKRLFDPVGMKDTSFWISPENASRYAHPYIQNRQTKKLEETIIPYMYSTQVTDPQRPPLGGAGLFSSAHDIACFYQMALNGGAANGKQIVKPQTLATMTQNQIGDLKARPGMPWGYGFCVITDPSAMDANHLMSPGTFGHGGAFGTGSWADPKRGVVYVIMLERDKMGNPDNTPMHIQFQTLAAQALDKR